MDTSLLKIMFIDIETVPQTRHRDIGSRRIRHQCRHLCRIRPDSVHFSRIYLL